MREVLTYIFPGQGSQQKGMGERLFEEFQAYVEQADRILGYSLKELCREDPGHKLGQTQYTQAALFVVGALSYLKKIGETGRKPDYVAGHSIGEYNALFAAEAFDFVTGLKLVKRRGELMGQATGGAMAAVIGLDADGVGTVLQRHQLESIDLANYNSAYQIVISGPQGDVERAKVIFEGTDGVKMVVPLKTSGAFHSRYMAAARGEFETFLQSVSFSPLTIPVISNVYARPYRQDEIAKTLGEQITQAVKWTDIIRSLMAFDAMQFEEIGSGKVLTGLVQRIKREATPLPVTDWDDPPRQGVPAKAGIEGAVRQAATVEPTGETETAGASAGTSGGVAGEGNPAFDAVKPDPLKPEYQTGHGTQTAVASGMDDAGPAERATAAASSPPAGTISAASLGDPGFKRDYNLKYAYLAGGMYRGVATPEMVVKMGKAGMMGFLGTGGLRPAQIEAAIRVIREELSHGEAYGMNLLHNPYHPELEEETVDLFLHYQVPTVEASAFLSITPALVRYKAKGLTRDGQGKVTGTHRIIAKVSRPELAEAFLSPAPERIVAGLLADRKITPGEAACLKEAPLADDLCVEADSGGHTDGGVAYALMPAFLRLRDAMMGKYPGQRPIRLGAAGGIGTPAAAAAAFLMGADFILTGSVNQCTVEAGTSDSVKNLLQQMNVQDTEYAPAGDMFELGAKVQVLKKGLFFPARANRLYELYRQYNSLNEIDPKTRSQLEERYFRRSLEAVYEEVKAHYPAAEIEKAETNAKHKMALVFRWYFNYSTRLALDGNEACRVDYQVHCGPALGSYNQWVMGTPLQNWRNRHVDAVAIQIMDGAAEYLNRRFREMTASQI
jgi:trans-AT polyketide synthase/acyltransferase/oxidoreductase domain-containing protein